VPALLIGRAEAALGKLAARAPAGTIAAVRVEVGTPWRTIVDAAARESAELIVIGSHGFGGLDRLLGTTAAKVVDHAKCSVLVARPAHAASA
jgi:nucleotide-binding universal stress UspA family protein